jgi:hypothetical protein
MSPQHRPEGDAIHELFTGIDPDQRHYLLNPPLSVLDGLGGAATTTGTSLPPLRILAQNDTLYETRHRFPLGSRLQELIDDGQVTLRKSPVDQNTTALVSDTELTTFVVIGDLIEWFRPAESGDPPGLFAELDELWDDSERYSLRTPPLAPTLDAARERLGDSFADRFTRAVEWDDELSDPTEFHAIRAAVVIGAAEEQLHYDVSKWGENAGVASKASFSRHKGDFEEGGLVRTEKVAVDMGRPRQRLFLTEEYRDLLDQEGLDALLAAAME